MLETSFSKKIKPKIYLLLFIFPLCYLLYSLFILYETWPVFAVMVDPYYAYLMNGTNLAGGHLEIGHLDHPGTPVQCFAAIVIFIKHLFFGSGATYKDVLIHPENYLLACNCAMLILFISVTFYTRIFVYRHTKNWVTSLLFQSVPLLMQGILFRTSKLAPEAFIIIWGTLFIAYFYIHFVFNDAQEKKENISKKIFFCGLFIGLLVASKFTCALIILLPFIVIKGTDENCFCFYLPLFHLYFL